MSIKHRLKARNEILARENASLRARVERLEKENFDLAVNYEARAMRCYEDAIEKMNRKADDLRLAALDVRHDAQKLRALSVEREAEYRRILKDIERDGDQGEWWLRGDAPPWEGGDC